MRLKLDENLGALAARALLAAGHDVEDVHGEGLCGRPDTEVLGAAVREDRILVTLDVGFADSLRFRPRDYTGLVVIRIPGRHSASLIGAAVQTLVAALAVPYPSRVGPRRYLWIVEVGRVRVHQDWDDPDLPDEAGEESPGYEEFPIGEQPAA
jgi:predicted nuclease of predicted toxin-antitoxin system